LDPDTVISALAKADITTMESVIRACPLSFPLHIHYAEFDVFSQVRIKTLAEVKELLNSADNVNIIPIHVFEAVSRAMFFFFYILNFQFPRNVES
jgi:hypothetical protein